MHSYLLDTSATIFFTHLQRKLYVHPESDVPFATSSARIYGGNFSMTIAKLNMNVKRMERQ